MKFMSLVGRDEDDESYINFMIEGGSRDNCIGDQLWISGDGKEMQVCEYSDSSTFKEILDLFDTTQDKIAFKGAMRRVTGEGIFE